MFSGLTKFLSVCFNFCGKCFLRSSYVGSCLGPPASSRCPLHGPVTTAIAGSSKHDFPQLAATPLHALSERVLPVKTAGIVLRNIGIVALLFVALPLSQAAGAPTQRTVAVRSCRFPNVWRFFWLCTEGVLTEEDFAS